MRLPRGIEVGAATHTGMVRAQNEDDYFVGALPQPAPGLLLCAIADGMGGVAGGAEASRLALRALGATVLDGQAPAAVEVRFRDGFRAASARVFAEASTVPALRDMGTTLTALCFVGDAVHLGHVGDTRAYRCRRHACECLTVDHAAREPDNVLLRCIGGGKDHSDMDHTRIDVQAGDRFVLVSDGVWSAVPAADLARLVVRGSAQAAAEALVTAALRAGGPDNATAVVVDVRDPTAVGVHDVDLPRDERPSGRDRWPRPGSLRPALWPWLLWAVALVLLAVAASRWAWGVDAWRWLASRVG